MLCLKIDLVSHLPHRKELVEYKVSHSSKNVPPENLCSEWNNLYKPVLTCWMFLSWSLIQILNSIFMTYLKQNIFIIQNYSTNDKFWEANMNWIFSYAFKVNINQLIFNQGCQPEKFKNQCHYFPEWINTLTK